MRHGKRINSLGRTAPHRKALLSNMATSLILHKRITTTVAKAKELRKYVEPLITKSKTDSTHSRRVVFSYLQDKDSVRELFDEVSEKVVNRPGGYTRIIKMGNRLGDNADMCMIELVDYNELLLEESKPSKAKTRRGRRGKKEDTVAAVVPASEVVEEVESKETEVEAHEIADAEVVTEVAEVVDEAIEVVEEAADTVEELKVPADEKAKEENVEEKPSGKDDSQEEEKDTKKE